MSPVDKFARARLRILRHLVSGPAIPRQAADDSVVVLESGDRGAIGAPKDFLRAMASDGLIAQGPGEIRLLPEGALHLKRASSGDDRFARQHGEWIPALPDGSSREAIRQVNLAESPLGALARLRDKDGAPYLGACEVRAGERLRADFTHGQLTPRLGINWQAPHQGGKGGCRNGAADLADSVIAARERVNRALGAVGPELADVLLDTCCFLKGLGTVEAERGWPARSAKLMLRTALSALARHYEPPREPHFAGQERIRHWGVEGYRPRQFGADATPS